MLKFFLDADGGSLAFMKEEDEATFDMPPLFEGQTDDGTLPVDVEDAVDVSGRRSALVCISSGGSYQLDFYVGKTGGVEDFFLFDTLDGLEDNQAIGVDVSLFEYFYVVPSNIDDEVTIEVGLVDWEDGE